MSSYTFNHPTTSSPSQLSKAQVDFLEHFYQISDDPGASREYADVFVEEGELVMLGKKVVGQDAIHTLRLSMWDPVVSRSHNPIAVYPSPAADNGTEQELMLHGTVSYTLKDGRKCQDVEWAARGTLVQEEKSDSRGNKDVSVKWKRYQVYMDSAAMVPR